MGKVAQPGLIITREASADLSARQYHAVKIIAGGRTTFTDILGEYALGILQNRPRVGEAAAVCVAGTTFASADAAIAEGAEIAVQNNGRIRTATIGNYVLGRALEPALATGNIIEIILDGGYFRP